MESITVRVQCATRAAVQRRLGDEIGEGWRFTVTSSGR
jgi:hypothetical protein